MPTKNRDYFLAQAGLCRDLARYSRNDEGRAYLREMAGLCDGIAGRLSPVATER